MSTLAKALVLFWIQWMLSVCDGNVETFEGENGSIIHVDWKLLVSPYETQTAEIGDSVVFRWPIQGIPHDVWIHPSGTCDETGRIAVDPLPEDRYFGAMGGLEDVVLTDFYTYEYTFTESDDGKKVVFSCDIGSHCEGGNQIIEFVVGDAQNTEVIPDEVQTPATENVTVDVVETPATEDVTVDVVETPVLETLSESEGFIRKGGSSLLLCAGLGIILCLF